MRLKHERLTCTEPHKGHTSFLFAATFTFTFSATFSATFSFSATFGATFSATFRYVSQAHRVHRLGCTLVLVWFTFTLTATLYEFKYEDFLNSSIGSYLAIGGNAALARDEVIQTYCNQSFILTRYVKEL